MIHTPMLKGFLNLLLPQICPLCSEDSEDGGFCRRCFADIRLIRGAICPCCGMPFVSEECESHLCGRCIIKEPQFRTARSAGVYKGVLLEAIHRFKYNGKTSLAKPLIKIMTEAFPAAGYDVVVPVPLHKTRLRERGFNQSLLLAKGLAKAYNLPTDYLNLKRIRATVHQVNLKGKDRLLNVRSAFAVKDKAAFQDKKVLLVDDVYTTGATVGECSKVLKEAGAESIYVLTLARVADL